MATKLELMSEAYRRGVLPEKYKPMFEEALRRGLVSDAIDDETGAGWKERFAIGSAASDEDKLARTRAFYGDSARREKDGRLSFVHPETGKRTYVNPSGFDMGDVFGAGRDAASVVAGIPAGIAGTVGGGGVNLVTGALAGSAGGAAAGQGVDSFAAWLARKAAEEKGHAVPEMQSVEDAAKEFGTETALGTAGGTVLGAAGRGLAKAFNPMKEEIVAAFKAANMPIPTVGTGTGSSFANKVENAAGSMFGGGAIRRARDKAALDLQASLDNAAEDIAGAGNPTKPASSVEELGITARNLRDSSREAFQAENRNFYSNLEDVYGDNPATLDNTQAAMLDMASRLSPESGGALIDNLSGLMKNELADLGKGNLNLNSVKAARTRIGERLDTTPTMDTSSVSQGQMKKLYGALSDDYRAALADPDAVAALDKHQAWEKAQHKARELLDHTLLGGHRSPIQTGKALLNPEISSETVDALSSTLSTPEFRALSGGILRNAARPTASEGLEEGAASAVRLGKVLDSGVRGGMSEEVQKKLWGNKAGTFREVAKALAKSAQGANTSRTAETQYLIDLLKRFGTVAVTGGIAGLPGAAAGAAVPWIFSKATTNPWLIRHLAKPQSKASKLILNKSMPVVGREGARGLLDIMDEDKPKKKK